jgi:hypothetical protein
MSTIEGRTTYTLLDAQDVLRVNLAREEINLDKIEDYIKKLDYVRRDNRFYFFNFFLIMHNQAFYAPNTIKSK